MAIAAASFPGAQPAAPQSEQESECVSLSSRPCAELCALWAAPEASAVGWEGGTPGRAPVWGRGWVGVCQP